MNKIPKEALSAERDVLQSLIYSYKEVKSIKRIEEFELDWFPTIQGKRIWQALMQCKRYEYGGQELIDYGEFHINLRKRVTGESELRLCERYFSELNRNQINIFTFADNVARLIAYSTHKAMQTDAENTLQLKPNLDEAQSILWRKQQALAEIAEKAKGVKLETIMDAFAEYDECIRDVKANGKEPFLTTGYASINAKVKKLKAGRLVVLAARPGIGKTTFALNLVVNNLGFINKDLKDSMAIGFISLEMTRLELLKKLICIKQKCLLSDIDKVVDGDAVDVSVMNQIQYARKDLEKANLLLWDRGNIDIGKLVAQIKRWHGENPNLKLVVIDYLQLVGSLEKDCDESRQQQIGVSSRTLKLLAQELNICIVALAQLNRKIEDRRSTEKSPQLADLRESGDIEQDADVVMCLYEAFEKQDNPEGYAKDIKKGTRLIILKNRHGGTGEVEMHFNKATGKFTEISEVF